MSEKVEQKRKEKKLDMISSFIKVFCELGLDGTYMRRLASSAGVSEALLYRYFENKDDIIRQCIIQYHGQIQEDLSQIFAANLHHPNQMSDKVLEYVDSVIDICRFLLQVMAHPAYSIMMEKTGQQVNEYIQTIAYLMERKLALDHYTAYGTAFLLNSIVNDYILKKSRENFLAQFHVVELLMNGNS